MIYLGEYYNDGLYGTSKRNKIIVQTSDDATFLLCDLEVQFNEETWSHSFEIPFFNDEAEFYFENYIHSIITQKFELPDISISDFGIYEFDIAKVNIILKEKHQNDLLDELAFNFYMVLGDVETYIYRKNLNTLTPKYITQNGILSFSFISDVSLSTLLVDNGNNSYEINLPPNNSGFKIYTLVVPIVQIVNSANVRSMILSVQFDDGEQSDLGQFFVNDDSPEHNLLAYQNYYGSLTILEFTGELRLIEEYKIENSRHNNTGKTAIKTTAIEHQHLTTINTGFILDQEKHSMIAELIKSFNIFLLDDIPKRVIIEGNPKISPYMTNNYIKSETLKLKLSENDNSVYGIF